jgi:hypothetical protein
MNPDQHTTESLIADAGGREKVSAGFLAQQLEGNSDRCNAVMQVLAEVARAEKYRLITDTITAADPEKVGLFVSLMMMLAEEPVFDDLLESIIREVPAESALTLFCKSCAVFFHQEKFRPLIACATCVEILGDELITRNGRGDLGAAVGESLILKAKVLHVSMDLDAALVASDHAVWFITTSGFFPAGSTKPTRLLADSCLLHDHMLVEAGRLDDARFYFGEANATYLDLLNAGEDTADQIVSTFRILEEVLTKSGHPDGAAICKRAAASIAATIDGEGKKQ